MQLNLPTIFDQGVMRKNNRFKLQFGSLSFGLHDYQFEMDSLFFEDKSESLVKDGYVEVLLNVDKAETHLLLRFKLKGRVNKVCDICLSNLDYPIKVEGSLHIKMTDKPMADAVDIMHIPINAVEVDLTDYFYDSLILSLPMQIRCEDALNRKECDESVIKILNADREEVTPNPEWQKLKNLFNKN